jgi:glucosamine--fructose-6-phosphate aminotransferase (isomerizing)
VRPLVDAAAASSHLSLIGRGPSLASAHEGALILKEAARRSSEAVSGGLFRHGPIEVVSERGGYIFFPGDSATRGLILGLGRDIARYGGRVVYVGAAEEAEGGETVALPETHPLVLPILEIAPIQLLALALAAREGRTIGGFERLTKVTRVE